MENDDLPPFQLASPDVSPVKSIVSVDVHEEENGDGGNESWVGKKI